MKVMLGALVVVLVALAGSACGSSGGTATPGPPATKTASVAVHFSTALANLPPAVRKAVQRDLRANKHPTRYSTVSAIEVYGPATRSTLDAASEGGLIATPTARKTYYLTVLYGHFVCISCSRPPGASSPRGSVQTTVWSPTSVGGDFGLMRKLPHAVSRLHRLIRVRIVRLGRL